MFQNTESNLHAVIQVWMSLEDTHHRTNRDALRLIPTLIGKHRDSYWHMCSTMIISNSIWHHCSLAGSWPIGQLLPRIHRGYGQVKRHIPNQGMHEKDRKITFCCILSTLVIRPGEISTLYTHCNNQSAVRQYTFLPCEHHLASSISHPESSQSQVNWIPEIISE